MRRQTGWAERENWDRGGRGCEDWMNYDQGAMSTHLARCFISSPRTCRFLSGSLWTRQWMAWMRASGLPPSVQTQKQPYSRIKPQGFLRAPRVANSQRSCDLILYNISKQLILRDEWYTIYTVNYSKVQSEFKVTETENKSNLVEEQNPLLLWKTIGIHSGNWAKVSGPLRT